MFIVIRTFDTVSFAMTSFEHKMALTLVHNTDASPMLVALIQKVYVFGGLLSESVLIVMFPSDAYVPRCSAF